jgi:putative phosphoesterase
MKVAALYDVHGMPWALEAVLADVERENVETIVFGGDYLYGPYPQDVIRTIRSLPAESVRGNADEDDPWAATLPLTVEVDGVTYCHAAPASNTPITTAITPDDAVRATFGDATGTFVIGHTHHQFDRRVGELRVINAGSVGMAYESEVAAFWTLMVDGEPSFRKSPFDVDRAVRETRASGWEPGAEFVAENLLQAPSRDEAIAVLEARRT